MMGSSPLKQGPGHIVKDIAKTIINPGGKVVDLLKKGYDYFKDKPTSESKPTPGPREIKQTTPQGSEGKDPTGKVVKTTEKTTENPGKLMVPKKLKGKQPTTISHNLPEKDIIKKQTLTSTTTTKKSKRRKNRKNK